MADPFEVRLKFTSLLSHLSASTSSSHRTAAYALKHRDMDEDLHSCILEVLEDGRTNMNARANIMYFLEHFCSAAGNEHPSYVEFVKRDVRRIVEWVAPQTGGGANVKVCRKVVGDLSARGVLDEEMAQEIEEVLKEREGERGGLLDQSSGAEEESKEVEMTDAPAEPESREQALAKMSDSQKTTPKPSNPGVRQNGMSKMDKRVIEQRIEEDRERNKRLRESVWAVSGDDDEEFQRMWEEGSDLGPDDYTLAQEEAEERAQFARYHHASFV